MAEYPILFNDEMVRAILDGRKTQTRRVVKPQPETYEGESGLQFELPGWHTSQNAKQFARYCPYGRPGDTLWVRETYKPQCGQRSAPGLACGRYSVDGAWFYAPDKSCQHPGSYLVRGVAVPSIHMPRWASRITLEVTAVRVERVQEISENDAKAEGVELDPCDHIRQSCEDIGCRGPYGAPFSELWDSINAKRGYGWESNPWVWIVEFRRKPEGEHNG